jgi:hypothetical protein
MLTSVSRTPTIAHSYVVYESTNSEQIMFAGMEIWKADHIYW